MRKLIYVLLGVALCVGAFGLLGVRKGPERSSVTRYCSDRGGDVRGSLRDSQPEVRTATQTRQSRDFSPRGWKLVEMTLDALNVLVGIVGIGLAVMGLRMKRAPMSQSIQGKADR